MHILMLNDDALPYGKGGAAVIVDRLRRAYAAHGHKVTLISTHQDSDDLKRWKDDAGETISIPVKVTSTEIHKHCVSVTKVSAILEDLLKDLHCDVTHAHNVHSYLTYDALRVAALHTKKVVMTIHDTYLISFSRVGGDAYRNAVLHHKPYRMYWWDHLFAVGRKYYPQRNRKIRSIIKESNTQIVVYSHAMENFLHDHGYTHTTFISGGMTPSSTVSDVDVFTFRKKHDLTGPVILFGGRISADKGIDALLVAAETVIRECPEVTFLIAGDKARLSPHLEKASPMVKAHTKETGWIDVKEMETAYHASDIVTTPSIYLDNFPTINLEAMAAGKPVVGTCFGGTPELVENGKTGYICNPLNTKAYSDALIDLLQHEDRRQQMGKVGQQRIHANFTMERQAQAYLALFI